VHNHGKTSIQAQPRPSRHSSPFAGHFASAIFALGFIGSGLLPIPVLAGAGSAAWPGSWARNGASSGPSAKPPVFCALVARGTLGGTALSLLQINPIKLLIFVAVINGAAAAPFVVVVVRVSGSRHIMGDYVNGDAAEIIGWLTAALMAAAAISCSPPAESPSDQATPRPRRRQLCRLYGYGLWLRVDQVRRPGR